MATNVTNIIELRGKPERVQKLLEVDKIIPMPGNLYMGDVPRDGPKPYGKNNWLDWSRANWGPKWDAYGFDNRPKDTPANTLWFLSANQPPHPVIQRLSEMYPDVVMEHLWADTNLGYGCGTCTYKAGQKIEECYPDYERYAYADVQLFGVQYVIDRDSIQNHLCQNCLDSINCLWFTDQAPAEFAIVSFEHRTIQPLLNANPWFSSGDFDIDCEFKENGEIDLLVHYCLNRYV